MEPITILTNNDEKRQFRNVANFEQLPEPVQDRYKTKVDTFEFFANGGYKFEPDRDSLPSSISTEGGSKATLFVIEGIKNKVINDLLKLWGHRDDILACLEEYLDNDPSHNFTDIDAHLPPLKSHDLRKNHVSFKFRCATEFDRSGSLDDQEIRRVAECYTWRDSKHHGVMRCFSRKERDGSLTHFPPAVVSRRHFAAWFDTDNEGCWGKGLILIDPPVNFGEQLHLKQPSYRRICHPEPSSVDSVYGYRSSFRETMKDLRGYSGVPPPFIVLRGIYRIMAAEWAVINTYFTRDLNTVGWALQSARSGDLTTAERFEEAQDCLFGILRRVTHFRNLIRSQRDSCRQCGIERWGLQGNYSKDPKSVSDELIRDFDKVRALIKASSDRVERNICHLNSLASILHSKEGIKEAQRSFQQNNMIMILTFVATLFLPINAVAAILGMNAGWAPTEPGFGVFWAICGLVFAFLIAIFLLAAHWANILALLRERKAPWSRFG